MEIDLLAFAHVREKLGFSRRTVTFDAAETPRQLLGRLFPTLDLRHLAVALDDDYVALDAPIGPAKELALIPPVSGG